MTRLFDFNWVYFTESKKTRISCGHTIYVCVRVVLLNVDHVGEIQDRHEI